MNRERPADTENYDRVVDIIRRQVLALNLALGFKVDETGFAQAGVTFGYIGDLSSTIPDGKPGYDTRQWIVLLPHLGRVGTVDDHIGSFGTGDLDGARSCLVALSGALAIARLVRR